MENQKIYHQKRNVTLVGLFVNILLSIIKYIVGIIGGSSALIADAIHSISDSVTDFVVLIGIRFSSIPADKNHPYGHGKFETFASFSIGIVLIGAAGILIYECVGKMIDLFEGKSFIQDGYEFTLIAAFFSVISKEILYRYTIHYGKKLNSSSLIANAREHRSDAISSIGVIIGVVCALLSPKLLFMDPLAGMIVSGIIAHMGWKIMASAFHELVDTIPDEEMVEKIIQKTHGTLGVMGVRNVRCRSLGGDLSVDMEILVDPTLSLYQAHDISENVKGLITKLFPVVKEVIVHVEPCENIIESPSEQREELLSRINQCVLEVKEVLSINNIRFHYIPGGLEVNIDVVVDPHLTVKEGHEISDCLEAKLQGISDITLAHIHLEFEKKF